MGKQRRFQIKQKQKNKRKKKRKKLIAKGLNPDDYYIGTTFIREKQ